jgi:vitamin B12 transporter
MINKLLAVTLLFPVLLVAQEDESKKPAIPRYDVVVSATLEETTTDKVGSSVTVITAEQIEKMQARTVLEALQFAPGVEIAQNGGLGQTASVFIRGAKSEHTLLMIDGVEMNDIISPGRSYDFAHLTTDNIERIEIIRGPQSVLYGSDAMGGVINIITKKGAGEFSGRAMVEAGSYATYRTVGSVNGSSDMVNFAASGSYLKNDGFSAANEELDGNQETDGYENASFSGHLGMKPTEKTGFDLYMRYTDSQADIDNGGGAFNDDPNNFTDYQQLSLRGQGKALVLDNKLELVAGLSYSKTDRAQTNDVDVYSPFVSVTAEYRGDLISFDARATYFANENFLLMAGFESQEETGSSEYTSVSEYGPYTSIFDEQSVSTNSVFGQAVISYEGLNATAGVRYDDHEMFGDKTTVRATAAYAIKGTGTILRGSVGTGFKAPSLYQLYSSFGSLTLEPEESTGWDLGIEQALVEGSLSIGATWFFTEFENMIDFDNYTYMYMNFAEAESQGLELFATANLLDNVTFFGSYTYTDAKDNTTDEKLLRRAEHRANGSLNVALCDKANLTLSGIYVGPRDDSVYVGFMPSTVELDSFFLLNLAGSYDVMEQFRLFGRLHNLFDEEYEWVSGYATAGVSGYFGGSISF